MILVFDREGAIFSKLRDLDLDIPLWRVSDPARLQRVDNVELAVLASYDDRLPEDLLAHVDRQFETVIVAQRYDDATALAAALDGAVGYLDAKAPASELRRSLQAVLAGEPGFSGATLGAWLRRQRGCAKALGNVRSLTDRQREVLKLIADGLADKEIATRLGIATPTAQKHVTNILERLGVSNRAAAAASVCWVGLDNACDLHVRSQARPPQAPQRLALGAA